MTANGIWKSNLFAIYSNLLAQYKCRTIQKNDALTDTYARVRKPLS